jgi:hypothetical protein
MNKTHLILLDFTTEKIELKANYDTTSTADLDSKELVK